MSTGMEVLMNLGEGQLAEPAVGGCWRPRRECMPDIALTVGGGTLRIVLLNHGDGASRKLIRGDVVHSRGISLRSSLLTLTELGAGIVRADWTPRWLRACRLTKTRGGYVAVARADAVDASSRTRSGGSKHSSISMFIEIYPQMRHT